MFKDWAVSNFLLSEVNNNIVTEPITFKEAYEYSRHKPFSRYLRSNILLKVEKVM